MTTANILSQLGSAGVSTGFKNRIINGAMAIWQRGTSFTNVGYGYSADRWAGGPFVGTQSFSQSTSVPSGFQYSLKVQRPASSTSTGPFVAMQTIESNNCYDLSGQTITLSFWAKAGANFSPSNSAIGVQVATGTTADQGGSTYYAWAGAATPIASNATLSTTWTKYTFTGTCGSGVLEMAVLFISSTTGTAGADDAFYITGVQLEAGTTATNFDYRPYGTELALCQRYCNVIRPNQTACGLFSGMWFTSTGTLHTYSYPVQMRAAPTLTYSALGDFQTVSSAGVDVASAISATGTAVSNCRMDVTSSGTRTAGQACIIQTTNTSSVLNFSAEL